MNYRDIIVFDFETGSANPNRCQPTQIAAIALHGRKLTLQPGGVFNSEIRPILDDDKAIELGLDPVEDEALEITHKTRKELAKAPQPKQVWKKFSEFVNKFNFKKTQWYAPIPAGYNINGFDLPIVQRMCEEHGPTNQKGKQSLCSAVYKIDIMDIVWFWMESNPDVKSISLDNMRKYMEFPQESKDNAHDALQDVKDTANMMIRFMKFHRSLSSKTKFDKAFADGDFHIDF